MKKIILITAVLLGCLILTAPLSSAGKAMDNFFPTMDGWHKKGSPAVYTPDNLYEYINGAADVFLSYDFQELASLSFENTKKHSFTVDIYRHSDERNGFGIYSQEKPRKGDFLEIGAQGYYEKGVLNFLRGSYYVKISGFDLGDQDRPTLTKVARLVAEKLQGSKNFPTAVASLPAKGKKENSERYVAQNFLGHSFMHSAYVADYEVEGVSFKVFVIETADDKGTAKILESYTNFARGKGKTIEENKENNYCSFQDPYYRSSGLMYMKRQGKYLWGLFSKTPALADEYISEVGKNLSRLK